MVKRTLLLAMLSLLHGIAYANQSVCFQLYGQTLCGPGTIANLNASGLVNLEKTHITKLALIHGNLNSDAAILHTITVQGQANLKQTKILADALILGDLYADHSSFQQKLTLVSNHAVLNNTHTHSILIKDSHDYRQTITLKGKSIIDGDIQFSSGHGVILRSSQAKILGKVHGAKIEILQ